MTLMVPKPVILASGSLDSVTASASSKRAIWAERRRLIEQGRHAIGPDGRRSRWPGRLFDHTVRVFGWGMRGLGLHARGRRNALDPRLVELELCFPQLPAAFDGYRILHVSDTHFDMLPELARVAARLLSAASVDVVALTGDIHGHRQAPLADSVGPLAAMLDRIDIRARRLAVLGNHDPTDMAEALEGIGLEVLINQSTVLERQGHRILVTGLDDVHCFYTEAARDALQDGTGDFRIALVHSAEIADYAAAAGYTLYLCGHTHGGQVCLPGGRPLVTHLKRCRYGAKGLWHCGPMTGYTSHGLGVSGSPIRYNCHGELAVITLRRSEGAGTASA